MVGNEFVRDPVKFSNQSTTFADAFSDFSPRQKKNGLLPNPCFWNIIASKFRLFFFSCSRLFKTKIDPLLWSWSGKDTVGVVDVEAEVKDADWEDNPYIAMVSLIIVSLPSSYSFVPHTVYQDFNDNIYKSGDVLLFNALVILKPEPRPRQ